MYVSVKEFFLYVQFVTLLKREKLFSLKRINICNFYINDQLFWNMKNTFNIFSKMLKKHLNKKRLEIGWY